MFKGFVQIFKDNNDWNEKTIIGFISFTVMVVIAAFDLITGLEGMNLEIKDYIYNSFMMLTLGSFGIAGLEKFSPANKVRAESEYGSTTPTPECSCVKECPNCGTSLE